jgi:hypothetical protein
VIRPRTADEQEALAAGLRSSEALPVRRCQILLASAEGQHPTAIGCALRCHDQTVRHAIHTFQYRGVTALQPRSSRPRTPRAVFDARGRERRRTVLHQISRTVGQRTRVWALALAVEVSFAHGMTSRPVSGEAMRLGFKPLGVCWKRATHGITSPDSADVRKKTRATD